MLARYEKEHGRKPQVIAMGKTHLNDLQDYLHGKKHGLFFEGIDVILHNDPFGLCMAHKNDLS